jgi:hypothetical protein
MALRPRFPWMPWHHGHFVFLSRLKPLLQGRRAQL